MEVLEPSTLFHTMVKYSILVKRDSFRSLWVCSAHVSLPPFALLQVLDNDIVLKIERKILHEIPAELSGLLEPVSDPETRLKLLSNDTCA